MLQKITLSTKFGPTVLRINPYGIKFDGESDLKVNFAVAPQKPGQIGEKPIVR